MTVSYQFYCAVELCVWQMALEIMRIKNHSSFIWNWAENLQMFAYTEGKRGQLNVV